MECSGSSVGSMPELVTMIIWEAFLDTIKRPVERSEIEDRTAFLLAITGVNRTWRDVAIQRSSLWSTIDIDWPEAQKKTWLERSRGKPLDIRAHLTAPSQLTLVEEGEDSPLDFETLKQESSRWKSVLVRADPCSNQIRDFVGFILACEFPALEEMVLIVDAEYNPHLEEISIPDDAYIRYPALRDLSLRGFILCGVVGICLNLNRLDMQDCDFALGMDVPGLFIPSPKFEVLTFHWVRADTDEVGITFGDASPAAPSLSVLDMSAFHPCRRYISRKTPSLRIGLSPIPWFIPRTFSLASYRRHRSRLWASRVRRGL
ncbi:uncharacterized protein EI90DRAFT_796166 [Cantharellus anzutake]|uniref:uncharacterized protein n=1 Tax=Cantharellus anzutake TaxID=1750568 RepID=UPI00190362DC|nr:uncharacterized protein EI90DRAFT_796166 [Cantharellus anzutake]KAF8342851.1 hypothetical protein EI90DRAFT_796166 [Cantharellus anzutake]